MPGVFAAIGGINFVRPAAGTGDAVYQCTGTPGIAPPTERLQRFTYPGVNGQAIKKTGAGSSSGRVTGFIDATSMAKLETARAALAALCKGQSGGTITFYDTAISFSNGIVNSVTFGEFWGYGARSCLNFDLAWENTA